MNKIKLIISDFDGPLASLKEAHYQSLNKAIEEVAGVQYIITQEQHILEFDGLSTLNKLEKLHQEKQLPQDIIQKIFDLKQKLTEQAINKLIVPNNKLIDTFSRLKQDGYLIYVASNSIRKTIETGLNKLGINSFIDKVLSNEDVKNKKPHSEIYLQCMIDAGVDPNETLIIEDSPAGKLAAVKSGAFICDVDDVEDTTFENIYNIIKMAEEKSQPKFPAKNKVNVLIPMSGSGKRFRDAGYNLPKPLIDIYGKPMIQWVVDNLNIDANFIFIVQKDHNEQFNLTSVLKMMVPDCKVVIVDGLTEGAACSALLAKDFINNDKHLLIANSDQFINNFDIAKFIYSATSKNVDASILTFTKHNDPKWSYVSEENGYVVEVAEKKAISDTATIGVYFWNKGSDFVKYSEQMIAANDRTNNEFYIVPSYNWMLKDNKKIISHKIDTEDFWGLGTPEDLEKFFNARNSSK